MALIVNNNIPALQTYNAVNATTNSLQKSIQKLSTGLRINSAADDAAGLAISEKMRAQVRGLDRAVSNSQDGISMLQTAEGALSETHSILQRMRELSVQASNDTLTQQDRAYIQLEIDQLREEVTRIGNTTQFNKKKLLDGSAAVLWSSDNLSTKAVVNGGLRGIDQFGQKNAAEGNFVIDINATPGKAQVQKSDVFTIKHADVIMDVSLNDQAGINGVAVNNLPAGDYQITRQELAASYPVTFDATDSTTAAYLSQNLTLAINNTNPSKNYANPFTATVTKLDATSGTMTIKLDDGSGNNAELNFTGLNSGGTQSVALGATNGDFGATGNLKVDTTATKLKAGINLNKLTVEKKVKGAASATVQTGSTTLNFTISKAASVTAAGPTLKGAPTTPAVTTDLASATGIKTGSGATAVGTFAIVSIAGAEYLTGATPPELAITLAGTDGNASTAELTVNGTTYTGAGTTDVNTSGSGTITFANVGAAGHNVTFTFSGAATTPANGDTITFTATTSSVPAGPPGTATTTAGNFAFSKVSAGEQYLTKASQLEITVAGAGGAASTAKLKMGNGPAINANAVIDLTSLTGGSLIFEKVDGTNNVTVDFSGSLGNITNGDTVTFDLSAVSAGGAALESDLLKASDYKKGITFEPQDAIDAENSIYLRVASSYKPTTATTSAGIDFDYAVVDKAGKVVSEGKTTIKDMAGTVNVRLRGENGTEKIVKFDTKLNMTDADLKKVRVGDEVSYEAKQSAVLVGRYGTDSSVQVSSSDAKSNASVLMEVTSVSDVNGSADFKITANILNIDGSTTTRVANVTLNNNDRKLNSIAGDANNLLELDLTLNLNLGDGEKVSDYYKAGDVLVYNVYPAEDKVNTKTPAKLLGIQIQGEQNKEWNANWIEGTKNDVTIEGKNLVYAIDASQVNGQDVHFKNFYVNEKNGTVYTGDIILSLAKDFSDKIGKTQNGDVLASFTSTYIGQVAKGDVKLRDLDKLWNSEGRFLLDDPQNLTITQGDGTRTSVTLYATDTLQDASVKLNDAISKQLGQQSALHIGDGTKDPAANRFVTFVNEEKEGTSEALAGTLVIRSVVAGANGQISFAGDEELLNKLSLNEIQAAEENSFSVSVWDAHTGKSVASSVKITGNKLIGVVNENVDVVFDSMANVKVEWNEATKSFSVSKDEGSYQTLLHLADNTTVFQIGANEGEDMGVNFGDMRSDALGLNAVLVTDRESAARSITVIDNAIDKVSMQRAKIGAYQNRLEHTITNLTIASENLTAAESRIRDTDMAKEMMNFTKLQIMLQAGTSMLSQANTLPQNVLSLLR